MEDTKTVQEGIQPATEDAASAQYSSPSGTHTFVYTLNSSLKENHSKEERTENLADLRKSVLRMQRDVNKFLTQKMEDDKSATAVNGDGASNQIDERKEEENYGEEADDE